MPGSPNFQEKMKEKLLLEGSKKMANGTFVQLTGEDCTYLLTLINEMDGATAFTARQRGFTIPKLEKIRDGHIYDVRLQPKDIDYLLELIEDDEHPDFEQARLMAQQTLWGIEQARIDFAAVQSDIEKQREERRGKRSPKVLASAVVEQLAAALGK